MEWEIHKQIGAGSYGTVHLVKNKESGTYAALKTMNCFEEGHIVHGTLRELFFYTSFDSVPNVCSSLGKWKHKDKAYILMPLYPCTLETIYSHFHKSIPYNDYLRLFLQSVRGVRAMHFQGFLHRDIKPENILVDECASLADFNLMRWAGTPSSKPNPQEIKSLDSFSFFQSHASSKLKASVLEPSKLLERATTHVCTLWTRAPELVLKLLKRDLRCSYSTEIDVFSLGSTFLAFAAGDYVLGKQCSLPKDAEDTKVQESKAEKKMSETKEYKYLYGFLQKFGVTSDISKFYEFPNDLQETDWNSSPAIIYEYIKDQTLWNVEQLQFISKLLCEMIHPLPSKRISLEEVEKQLVKELGQARSEYSDALQGFIARKKQKLLLTKSSVISSPLVQCTTLLPPQQEFSALQFWSLCSSNFIPPFIACEIVRIKHFIPLNLQYSKALLYLLDMVHEFQIAENFKVFSGIDIEHVFTLCMLVKPKQHTVDLVLKISGTPFLVCCLASEYYVSGHCENEEELKASKTVHLSTIVPFFEAYGTHWKSQLSLRQTWSRL